MTYHIRKKTVCGSKTPAFDFDGAIWGCCIKCLISHQPIATSRYFKGCNDGLLVKDDIVSSGRCKKSWPYIHLERGVYGFGFGFQGLWECERHCPVLGVSDLCNSGIGFCRSGRPEMITLHENTWLLAWLIPNNASYPMCWKWPSNHGNYNRWLVVVLNQSQKPVLAIQLQWRAETNVD